MAANPQLEELFKPTLAEAKRRLLYTRSVLTSHARMLLRKIPAKWGTYDGYPMYGNENITLYFYKDPKGVVFGSLDKPWVKGYQGHKVNPTPTGGRPWPKVYKTRALAQSAWYDSMPGRNDHARYVKVRGGYQVVPQGGMWPSGPHQTVVDDVEHGDSITAGDVENPADGNGIKFVLGILKRGGKRVSEIQTILFDRVSWTVDAAKHWLKDHGFKVSSPDAKAEHLRFRQKSPARYKEFSTIEAGHHTAKNPALKYFLLNIWPNKSVIKTESPATLTRLLESRKEAITWASGEVDAHGGVGHLYQDTTKLAVITASKGKSNPLGGPRGDFEYHPEDQVPEAHLWVEKVFHLPSGGPPIWIEAHDKVMRANKVSPGNYSFSVHNSPEDEELITFKGRRVRWASDKAQIAEEIDYFLRYGELHPVSPRNYNPSNPVGPYHGTVVQLKLMRARGDRDGYLQDWHKATYPPSSTRESMAFKKALREMSSELGEMTRQDKANYKSVYYDGYRQGAYRGHQEDVKGHVQSRENPTRNGYRDAEGNWRLTPEEWRKAEEGFGENFFTAGRGFGTTIQSARSRVKKWQAEVQAGDSTHARDLEYYTKAIQHYEQLKAGGRKYVGPSGKGRRHNPRKRVRPMDALMAEHIRMPGVPQLIVTRDFAWEWWSKQGWPGPDKGIGSLDHRVFRLKEVDEPLTDSEVRDRTMESVARMESKRNPESVTQSLSAHTALTTDPGFQAAPPEVQAGIMTGMDLAESLSLKVEGEVESEGAEDLTSELHEDACEDGIDVEVEENPVPRMPIDDSPASVRKVMKLARTSTSLQTLHDVWAWAGQWNEGGDVWLPGDRAAGKPGIISVVAKRLAKAGKSFDDLLRFEKSSATKGRISNPRSSGEADQDAARELELFIENDGDLYRQQTTPINKNLALKKAKGTYKHDLAVKLWMYLMESGAKKYNKEFGGGGSKWQDIFTVPTRKLAAENFAQTFETEYDLGNYDRLLPAKYQKSENPDHITGDLGQAAFDAAKDYRVSGAYYESGVANARVARYGFIRWYNDLAPSLVKGHRKSTLEKGWMEGWAAGKRVEKRGNPEKSIYIAAWRAHGVWVRQQFASEEDAQRMVDHLIRQGKTAKLERHVTGSKQNPEEAAAALSEEFHGRPAETVTTVTEEIHEHEYLTELGQLVELRVRTLSGYDATIQFEKRGMKSVRLASSEDGKTLYVVGGDQELPLDTLHMNKDKWIKDKMVIGEIRQLTYRTSKAQDQYKETDYYHNVSENSKLYPTLVYDTLNKTMEIVGGTHQVKEPGIID